MANLATIYWLCFGAGLAWVLLAGALGAISHGFAGKHDSERNESAGDGASAKSQAAYRYSPFAHVSIMGTLAGFGAGGLLAANLGLTGTLSLVAAVVGAAVMAFALWLLIGKLMYRLHSHSAEHVSDMVGLDAEVLTPVEHTVSGEIAYMLDGTRYTAPARLVHEGLAGRSQIVRIRSVGDNIVYVEAKDQQAA